MHRERFFTLSASCPDRVGIVARVSGFIAEHKGWILETSLHAEPPREGEAVGRYFMRIEIKADSLPFHLAEFRDKFLAGYFPLNPNFAVYQGKHEFDGQLPDWSAEGLQKQIAFLEKTIADNEAVIRDANLALTDALVLRISNPNPNTALTGVGLRDVFPTVPGNMVVATSLTRTLTYTALAVVANLAFALAAATLAVAVV